MVNRRRLATTTGAYMVSRSVSASRGHFGHAWVSPSPSTSPPPTDKSRKCSRIFNLLEQLTFYATYHHNPWNRLLHFIFVPLIVWSVAVWAAHSGSYVIVPLAHPYNALFSINLALLWLVCYTCYYILLDGFAGLSWGLLVGLPLWVAANAAWTFVDRSWLWALAAHVLSWYIQIHPGHIVLEGRKPALLDSFCQSLVLAPLFVWFEVLFFLGYRPQLHKMLEENVEKELRKINQSEMQGMSSSPWGNYESLQRQHSDPEYVLANKEEIISSSPSTPY